MRTVSGTLPFVAPEVIEGRASDPRSDLLSLGAVLYAMAAGTPPFTGEGREALADAILGDDPPALSASGRVVPEELERIIGKALARDHAARYPTAAAMEAALRTLDSRSGSPSI